jgi:hypothetical protein
MTDKDLNAIRERVDAAAPAWGWCGYPTITRAELDTPAERESAWTISETYCSPENGVACGDDGKCEDRCAVTIISTGAEGCEEDFMSLPAMTFIASAPTDVRALLAEVARLTEERDSAQMTARVNYGLYQSATDDLNAAEAVIAAGMGGAEQGYQIAVASTRKRVSKLREERDSYRHDAEQRNQFAEEADRLEQERDGLAAVVAAVSRELPPEATFEMPESNERALNAVRDLILGPLAATLAARDAEKKAEGIEEAAQFAELKGYNHDATGYDYYLADGIRRLARTPQQGEQG